MTRKVAILLSRDEPDLLRENLTHHISQGVDGFIVTNHVSVEQNHAVLRDFSSHILAVIDKPEPLPFPQDNWRTQMARMAINTYKADWIIPADTDEFWYELSELDVVPQKYCTVACYQIYEHIPTPAFHVGMSDLNRSEMPYYVVKQGNLPKCIHRAFSGIRIVMCSHKPSRLGPICTDSPIYMRHYPIRSYARFMLKARTGAHMSLDMTRARKNKFKRYLWREADLAGRLEETWLQMIPTEQQLAEALAADKLHYFDPNQDEAARDGDLSKLYLRDASAFGVS